MPKSTVTIPVLTPVETAWVAGLLEGEGSFDFRDGTARCPRVTCQMTDLDVIERLGELLGGNSYATSKQQEHHKPAWRWQVQGEAAAGIMRLVLPMMGARRSAKIEEVLARHDARQAELAASRLDMERRAELAAQDFLESGDSLRVVGARHQLSHVTVKNYADKVRTAT